MVRADALLGRDRAPTVVEQATILGGDTMTAPRSPFYFAR